MSVSDLVDFVYIVVLFEWVLWERRVRRPALVVLACFGLGLAFALPLYLALRRADGAPVRP